MVGGLVTSTLLTLVIVPALYTWLPRRRAAQPGGAALEPGP
ncbi:MAG: hypothetical protein M5U28_01590 [Sandaracinaceae bacterium]|nr:hypothetical protein [Sandaracinaceae bacterium]